jgi:hypothetical protein
MNAPGAIIIRIRETTAAEIASPPTWMYSTLAHGVENHSVAIDGTTTTMYRSSNAFVR